MSKRIKQLNVVKTMAAHVSKYRKHMTIGLIAIQSASGYRTHS